MASRARRSMRIVVNEEKRAVENEGSRRVTRRTSMIAQSNTADKSTPRCIKTKLNLEDISKTLNADDESSSDEFQTPSENNDASSKNNLINNKRVPQIKIKRLPNNKYEIQKTPKRTRDTGNKPISYKEYNLRKNDEIKQSLKNQDIRAKNRTRKKSMNQKSNEDLDESDQKFEGEQNEVDENEKRYTKTASMLKQTPKKNMNTPKKQNNGLMKQQTPRSSKTISASPLFSPSKAMKKLNLNDSNNLTPRRCRMSIVTKGTPLKEFNSNVNTMAKKSSCQPLKNNNSKIEREISTRKRSAKPISTDPDYSENEESESPEEYEESESSDYQSESGSSSEEMYTAQGRKIKNKKLNLNTPKKTPPKKFPKVSMETPTKALSCLSLRNASIVKPSTPLQEARMKLHVSVVPKSLPCREEQFNDIYSFLYARLSDSTGGCIYVSGVPGTGKTATVNEVIRCLKKSMDAQKLPKFKFVDINGMKLSEPRQAYVQILKQLTGQCVTWEEAHRLLHDRFTKSKSSETTLLLVDEMDLLCTKRQDVVYNLLDWPSKSGAKLVVVTIANTMDLPERVLMGKVTSRLGLTRLTFPPYNHKQLEEIVVSRLKGYNSFSGETIQLVARKVAAVSGDARRALDICRRATEVAENNEREMVSMQDVKRALDEMIASPKIQAIKHCSILEQIFLQAVCTEVNRTGVEEVVFERVYNQLEMLCTFSGEKVPNVTEALEMCARLGSYRLLLCEHSKMDIHQRLLLNVSTDDVYFAIQNIET